MSEFDKLHLDCKTDLQYCMSYDQLFPLANDVVQISNSCSAAPVTLSSFLYENKLQNAN